MIGLSIEEIKTAVQKHSWWHSIDLGNGIVTPGSKSPEIHKVEFEALFGPIEISGKSFLDIGAWNGAHSFEASRRGSSRVLAVDSHSWTHPSVRGKEGLDLANSVLGNKVETRFLNITEQLPSDMGTFDVVLFAGVFYHLPNPIFALQNAASLAREVLIVETAIDVKSPSDPTMRLMRGVGGDNSNYWYPTPSLMIALLRDLGFAHIDTSSIFERGVFHAWRSTKNRRFDPASKFPLKV